MSAKQAVQRRRLKYAATINDEALGEETDPEYEMQYVDIGNVDSSGAIHEIAPYRFADAPSRARRRVRDGDVIISCVRTYLQAIAPIQSPPDNLIVSTGFAVVRPRTGVLDPAFGKYALREPRFLAEVEMRSVGVSYPAINASDLADITVYLPPSSQQPAIADFLDRETARLDALVAAKELVLGLLAEKRRALVTRAVTRGLDPRAPSAIPASPGSARFRRIGRRGGLPGFSESETSEMNRISHYWKCRSIQASSSASSPTNESRALPQTSIPTRSRGKVMSSSTRCGCGREPSALLRKTVSSVRTT